VCGVLFVCGWWVGVVCVGVVFVVGVCFVGCVCVFCGCCVCVLVLWLLMLGGCGGVVSCCKNIIMYVILFCWLMLLDGKYLEVCGGSVARCARCHMTPPSPSFCPLLCYCVIASQQLAQIWGLEVMNGAEIDPCFYCGAGFTLALPDFFFPLLGFFPLGGCAWGSSY